MHIHTDSHQVSRLEVVETGRRRRWSDAEKLRIVEESLSTPRNASATARRYVSVRWRRVFETVRVVQISSLISQSISKLVTKHGTV